MAGGIDLSSDERGSAMRMATDAVDLILANASLGEGAADEAANARLVRQSQDFVDRFDKALMLDLADRIGADALTEAVHDSAPPTARSAVDALIMREGGILPFVRNRLERVGPAGESALFDDTSVGCALGVVAIVAGVAIKGILGGFTAVVGIVAVAAYC